MAHDSPILDDIPFRTLGPISGAAKAVVGVLIAIGVIAIIFAASTGDPGRVWQSLLVNWLFWSSLSIGMVLFAAALHMSNADWAWSVRRCALAGGAFLPISFVLFLIVVFGGRETIFVRWLHVQGDPLIEAKWAWLNFPTLATRDIVFVLILYGLALAFIYNVLRPDVYGVKGKYQALYDRLTRGFRGVPEEAALARRNNNRITPVLAIVFSLVWGVVGIDFTMSLDPHFFSTMYPVAFFWAAFDSGVAATGIAVWMLRSRARLEGYISHRQSHDLGKLIFAFAVFWMYLNWGQYIVIWYGQLPNEQEFFVHRFAQPFGPIASAVVLLVFVVPFFGLLPKSPKRVFEIVAFFGGLILVGLWLERYTLVYPALHEGASSLPLGFPEIGLALGFLGIFVACYIWFVQRFPLLPSPAALVARGPTVVPAPPRTVEV